MAKELPYFKFEPNEWENGNIQMCSRENKGLFIDLCSMYWSRLGDLPIKLAVQKLCAGNTNALNSLCDDKIIVLENGFIRIDFLEEQLAEFENKSKTNRKIALEAWDKRRKDKALCETDANALKTHYESDTIREEKRREEEKREEEIFKEKKSQNEIYSIELLKSQNWIETISMQNNLKPNEINQWIETFNKKLISELDNKLSKKDYASHFSRWLPTEITKAQKNAAKKLSLEPYNDKEIWPQPK